LVPHSPPRPRRFRREKRFLPTAVPRSLAQTGSSSRTLAASSEYCRLVPAPRLPTWSASFGVACPLRDISPRRPYNRIPTRPPCRPRRFSRPRRFAPPPALWVYFTPQPRPGFALQGFLPSPSRAASSTSRALPSVDEDSLLAHQKDLRLSNHQRRVSSPRPQGFVPGESRLSARRCLAAVLIPSPPELFLLQVLSLCTVGAPSRSLRSWPWWKSCRSHLLH